MTKEKLLEANKINEKMKSLKEIINSIDLYQKKYNAYPIKVLIPIENVTFADRTLLEDIFLYGELKDEVIKTIYKAFEQELQDLDVQLLKL